MSPSANITRLLISCADRPGIVAAVSQFLAAAGANIVSSDQHSSDPQNGEFYMRMEFTLAPADRAGLEERFAQEVGTPFAMDWRMWDADRPKRVAILVSKYDNCLLDLLWRWRRGQLPIDIGLVISNHADLAAQVRSFGVPFVHIPVSRD